MKDVKAELAVDSHCELGPGNRTQCPPDIVRGAATRTLCLLDCSRVELYHN